MPKFPPNTGFKMPGIGSKEIDSPSNFRDEHHVDKMGYCDDTPDSMLPPGSSPLKYTPIIDDDPYTSVRAYDMSNLGKAIGKAVRKKKTKPSGEDQSTPEEELNNIQKTGKDTNTTRTKIVTQTPETKTTTGYQGKKMSDAEWNALSAAERRRLNAAAGADKSGKITKTTPGSTTTVYKVNGKVVDKATWDASASPNKTKETK
tara:strand:+ start:2312 stop:2920 length:609 start_codon:yes stop_codon:yes gene_type:complete